MFIGASLSEPHTSESFQRNFIFGTYVQSYVHPTVSRISRTNLSVIDYGFFFPKINNFYIHVFKSPAV